MADITLKIGDQTKTYAKGITALEIAATIHESLVKESLAVKLNDRVIDLTRPIFEDGELFFLTWEHPEGKEVFRHSSAHLMAHAVQMAFPEAKLTIGPATDDGFYYDIDFRPFTQEDFKIIEKNMERLAGQNAKFFRTELTKKEALLKFKDNPYKTELIEELPDGETITVYSEGDFSDLCRGPHLPSAGKIRAVKITKCAGAYWRGDPTKQQLQRLYGVSFPSKELLSNYLQMLQEAEKRDHRKVGKDLELFMINELSLAGCPFFLPNGTIIYNELLEFVRKEYFKRGYQEVITPQIFKKELWETSGHWQHYRENMLQLSIAGHEYSLKPMNCPSHLLIYKSKTRSYKDLPLRIADFCFLHRNELGGVLGGLTRVVKFAQDDSHIFCMPEQIESEVRDLLDFVRYVYSDVFKFTYKLKLSTRPESFMGEVAVWDKAEESLSNAMKGLGLDFVVKPGEGAFYGPKIDMDVKDSLGRDWQLATIQLDFQLPQRFDATYEGQDGHKHHCVMVHRAILGSLERFIGVLTEHFAGKFPLWLAPEQAVILTIADRHAEYAGKLKEEMRSHMLRVSVDDRSESISKKVREAQLAKIPLVITIGDKEQDSGELAVRTLDGKVHQVSKADLIAKMKRLIENKAIDISF